MLVDIGALCTKVSPAMAWDLGITPNEVIKIRLADGAERDPDSQTCWSRTAKRFTSSQSQVPKNREPS